MRGSIVKDKLRRIIDKIIEYYLPYVSIALIVTLIIMSNNISIWKDETCDLNLITHSYSYFLLSSRDSAPPLHFAILKFLVELTEKIVPSANTIIVAKMTSIVPYILIFIINRIYIKREFGRWSCNLFGFLIICMTPLFPLGIEIRQYSWSLLVTFLWFLATYIFYKYSTWQSVFFCSILGPLSLFAHYFCFFGIAMAYICILVSDIRYKRTDKIAKMIIIMSASVVLYIGWLFIAVDFIFQNATKAFKIEVTWKTVFESFIYIFLPQSNKFYIGFILAIVCILLFVLIVFDCKKNGRLELIYIIGIGIPFFTIICGLLIGKFVAPCFQVRYIVPMLGAFWLSLTLLMNRCTKKMLCTIFICLLFLVGLINVLKTIKDEYEYKTNIDAVECYLEENDSIILVDDTRLILCLEFYDDNVHINALVEEGYINDVFKYLSDNKKVVLFESTISDKVGLVREELLSQNVNSKYIMSTGIEYVFFDMYELSLEE